MLNYFLPNIYVSVLLNQFMISHLKCNIYMKTDIHISLCMFKMVNEKGKAENTKLGKT